jgi:sigma-B regulation protein RsbU (phosphoserine phosphatase)
VNRHRRWTLLRLSPAVVIAVVVTADLSLGSTHSVSSLTVIAPLLASSLVGPRLTAVYGLLAVLAWAVLASADNQFVDRASTSAALFRLGGIVVGSAIAVGACTVRLRREARLHRVERVAEVAQLAILVPIPERLGPVRLAARYESSAQDAQVGGDFYAAASTPYGTRVVVGDVRGKGLEAVWLAADVLGAFRERAGEHDDPVELLERLNDAVTRQAKPGDFVTAVIVQVSDTGALTIVAAGHPAPILVRGGVSQLLTPAVIRAPLGFAGRAQPVFGRLETGDQLVLYTDGATEARRAGDRAFRDEQRLLADVASQSDPAATVAHVFAALLDWTGGHLSDDVAVVALQYAPPVGAEVAAAATQSGDQDGLV